MTLVHSQQPVLFHLGQVMNHRDGNFLPFLETHTWPEVEWLFKPGTRVSLNARKIRGCYLPMQVRFFQSISIFLHVVL